MPMGPGKYDDLCTYVREQVGITNTSGGGVILIVMGGNKGEGFAVQADFEVTLRLPDMLETVAAEIRANLFRGRV